MVFEILLPSKLLIEFEFDVESRVINDGFPVIQLAKVATGQTIPSKKLDAKIVGLDLPSSVAI